jgi:hypothetical protein
LHRKRFAATSAIGARRQKPEEAHGITQEHQTCTRELYEMWSRDRSFVIAVMPL